MDRYSVFGNPIAHSLSPQIHQQFAAQCQQDIAYSKSLIELDGFEAAVNEFFAAGGKGLNITVPFKQEAWTLAEQRTQRAELAGAVNTLWMSEDGKLCGDNTDGAGLVNDLLANNWLLKNKNVVMLGAGGAARGVILPLLEQAPARLLVANRTLVRAHELQTLFAPYGPIEACEFKELGGQKVDLIINATSASLGGELPPVPTDVIHENCRVYDMVYANQGTPFMHWCQQQGARELLDGLGMLVGQAAESFAIWRTFRPAVQPVIDELRRL